MGKIIVFCFIVLCASIAFSQSTVNGGKKISNVTVVKNGGLAKPRRIKIYLQNDHSYPIRIVAVNSHVIQPGMNLELSLKPNIAIKYAIIQDTNNNTIVGPIPTNDLKTISTKTNSEFSRKIVFHKMKDKNIFDVYVEEYILNK